MADQNANIIDGQTTQTQAKRLYRSTSDRSLAGVCGGMAEYLGVDSGLVRLGWVLATLFTLGTAALLYGLLALVIPADPAGSAAGPRLTPGERWQTVRRNRGLVWGLLLLLAGILLILNNFDLLPVSLGTIWRTFSAVFWPLLLIGLGLFFLLRASGRELDLSRVRQAGANLPLRRSRDDRVLAGVCGGLGSYLNIDPVFVRLAWVVLTLLSLGTVGVILYLLAAFLLPLED